MPGSIDDLTNIWLTIQIFYDNTTGFVAPRDTKRLLPTFTHSFTPNDTDDPHASDKVSDSDALQNLGTKLCRMNKSPPCDNMLHAFWIYDVMFSNFIVL